MTPAIEVELITDEDSASESDSDSDGRNDSAGPPDKPTAQVPRATNQQASPLEVQLAKGINTVRKLTPLFLVNCPSVQNQVVIPPLCFALPAG